MRGSDFSRFSGLADLWEWRDRAFACTTVPEFQLETDELDKQEAREEQAETCTPDRPFDWPNRLLDETEISEVGTNLDVAMPPLPMVELENASVEALDEMVTLGQ